jgi:hypothetical protein
VAAVETPIHPAPPWYPWLKALVIALLACNTAVYVASGTLSEAFDSAAWLALLASFELETGFSGRFSEGRATAVLRGVRLAAAAAILAAAIGYVRGNDWLDAINLGLWIAIVILLELDVRAERARPGFMAITLMLYAGLAVLVVAWAWRGEWFDAYDALLWLIAFFTIEINVLKGYDRKKLA